MSTVTQRMAAVAETLPAGSEARKMLAWAAIELDDRAETIDDLEAEIQEYSDGYHALARALHKAKVALEDVNRDIHAALWQPEPPAKDLAPFKNVMAAHGVAPYAKAKRTKAVTT